MGTAKGFWNWTAERYSRQPIADEKSYRKKIEITQRFLTAEMNVVEFGCGTGSTAIQHAPKVKHYHAVDVSDRMIEIARQRAADAGVSNMSFSVGTLEEAVREDASCDAVLGLNILHLVPDLDGTLATVARILRPGGVFISSTICLSQLGGQLRWIARAASLIPLMPDVTSFSAEELEAKHAEVGIRIEERFSQTAGVLFLVGIKE